MRINLEHAVLEYTDYGCRTTFRDGAHVDAIPHDTHHYHVIAHRLGYQDDIMAYCREHEAMHEFVAEKFTGWTSVPLWSLAHGRPIDPEAALWEEFATHAFQRWLRANERPILDLSLFPGLTWDSLKAEALELLSA